MPIPVNFKTNIDFLSKLDPKKHSLALTSEGKLTQIDKRTKPRNFLAWFIYLITFTKIPQNASLDKVARHILNQAQDLNQSTIPLSTEEQTLICKATKRLFKVLKRNGSKNSSEIERLFNRIKSLKAGSAPSGSQERFLSRLKLEGDTSVKSLQKEVEKDFCTYQFNLTYLTRPGFLRMFPKLTPMAQEILLIQAFFESDITLFQKKYEKFLKIAIKMPIESWKRSFASNPNMSDFLYEIKQQPIIKAFFPILDQCENTTQKWELFDLFTRDFHRAKLVSENVFFISTISREQRSRLGLESLEPLVSFFKAIEERTLDLPLNKKVFFSHLKTVGVDLKKNFLLFLATLNPMLCPEKEVLKRLDALLYLISWLEPLSLDPCLLKECIQVIYRDIKQYSPKHSHITHLKDF